MGVQLYRMADQHDRGYLVDLNIMTGSVPRCVDVLSQLYARPGAAHKLQRKVTLSFLRGQFFFSNAGVSGTIFSIAQKVHELDFICLF